MRKFPLRTRRVLFGAFLSAVIFVVGDVALGFAAAGDEEPGAPPSPPATFGVPGPAVGDVVEYQWREIRGYRDYPPMESPTQTLLSLEWLGAANLLDGTGAPRTAHLARAFERGDAGRASEVYYDAKRHDLVGWHNAYQTEEFGEESLTPLVALGQVETRSLYTSDGVGFAQEGLRYSPEFVCGVYNGLQGRTINTSEPVPLFDRCMHPGTDAFWPPGPNAAFLATRTDRLGDRDAVVFVAANAGRPSWEHPDNQATYTVTAWLAHDIPYPLRVELLRDSGSEYGNSYDLTIMELSGFTRGEELLPVDDPVGDPAPAVELAAPPAWGIDDADVDHPFPLSEAYAAARNDANYDHLRNFLADHPDSFASSAAYVEFQMDGSTSRRWTVSVTDGAAFLEFCSYEEFGFGILPREVMDLVPANAPSHRAEDCDWVGRVVDPVHRPALMPKAASLLDHAQTYLDSYDANATANAYDFFLCPSEGDCAQYQPSISAGSVVYTRDSYLEGELPHFSADDAWRISSVYVDLTGFTTLYVKSLQLEEERANPIPPTPASEPGTANAQSLDTTALPFWQLPPPGALVGMGVVAVAAGALYMAWPALKGMVAPLFTRLAQPEALTHPNRRRIEALVRAEPGIHGHELARLLELPRGTVEHHLQQLRRVGVLTATAGPGYTCYFVAGTTDRRAMDAAPLLKAAGARNVLAVVVSRPGANLSEVAQATGLRPPTVHYHADRLRSAGLVETRRDGVHVLHFATDAGRHASVSTA